MDIQAVQVNNKQVNENPAAKRSDGKMTKSKQSSK